MLFTDAANPTSNGVYERLGYRVVGEVVELSDAGHTAAGDDNDAFSAAVVEFVTQI